MPKEARWHEMVKGALKEIGKERGYDVSESEKEMVLVSKFKLFRYRSKSPELDAILADANKRKAYTFSYKPDGVWKKGRSY